MSQADLTFPPRLDWRLEALALVGLLVLGLFLRCVGLDQIPTVFFCDECDNAVYAIRVLEGKGPGIYGLDWKPQPALAVNGLALSCALNGASLTSIRLPSAIFGALLVLPFYWLGRRVCGAPATLLASLLLVTHPALLHFSRAGWENIQVAFWSLLSMGLAQRAESLGFRRDWLLSGMTAGIAALTYFSGYAVLAFLLVYLAGSLLLPDQRQQALMGMGWLAVGFGVVMAPLLPTLIQNWDVFARRPQHVLLSRELPPDVGWMELVNATVENGFRSAKTLFFGHFGHTPRYFPPRQTLLGWLGGGFLLLGLWTSRQHWNQTRLWILAILIPFLLTQVTFIDSPNLARAIGLVPPLFLLIALGISRLLQIDRVRWMGIGLVALCLLGAGSQVWAYFQWASGPRLAKALEPAIPAEDFDIWWQDQSERIRKNQRFLTVHAWEKLHRATPAPDQKSGQPAVAPQE